MVLTILGLAVTGCGFSIGSVEPPEIADLPEEFAEDCARPIRIPERDLTEGESIRGWAQDRKNLSDCGDLHSQTVDWIQNRDRGITNER